MSIETALGLMVTSAFVGALLAGYEVRKNYERRLTIYIAVIANTVEKGIPRITANQDAEKYYTTLVSNMRKEKINEQSSSWQHSQGIRK